MLALGALALFAVTVLISTDRSDATGDVGNQRILFASERDGNIEIYIMDADGSDEARVTNDPASDHSPVIDCSGTNMYFVSDREGNYDLWRAHVLRGGWLSHDLDYDRDVTYTRLTTSPGLDFSPSVVCGNPDVVFSRFENGRASVFLLRPNGEEVNLTVADGGDSPALSPSGEQIAFVRNGAIWIMNADGSGQLQVSFPTETGEFHFTPQWSQDETKIVYTREFLGPGTNPPAEVREIDLGMPVTQRTIISGPAYSLSQPHYSPDDHRIVVSINYKGEPDIYTMDATDGGNQTQLTDSTAAEGSPIWQKLPVVDVPTPEDTPEGGYSVIVRKLDQDGNPRSNWRMYLYNNETCSGGAADSEYTGQSGLTGVIARFSGLAAGSYSLKEEMYPGYTAVSPACQVVTLQGDPADPRVVVFINERNAQFVRGDGNCDWSVTSVDAALDLQFDAGLLQAIPCWQQADANDDGRVNSLDASLKLQHVAGLFTLPF
jgi:TolB protein